MKLLLLLLLLMLQREAFALKLNYPRVLLPLFRDLSINFTLEVLEGGCFKWSSSRSDLITIQPLPNNADDVFSDDGKCASRARITSLAVRETRPRATAIVLAEDLATGEVLRCDVILDVIHALGVSTTTRELYLEEAPEQFELWAQDAQGNEFSSLQGIAFDWQILSSAGSSTVLQFLRYAQSAYHDVPAAVAQFESPSTATFDDDHAPLVARGSMTLLEGVNTGSARVAVRLPYAEYDHVAAVQVDITVLANIILDPIDAHILVGDNIAFRVLQLKQGKLHEITANAQYYLEIDDTTVANIDGKIAEGRRLGRTAVVLRDRNVRPSTGGAEQPQIPVPRATLTVCEPVRIELKLQPQNNWVTVLDRQHVIAVDLYTNENRRIDLGNRYKVDAHVDESMFNVLSRTTNGSRVLGDIARTGVSKVLATYGKLSTSAQLEAYEDLELRPKLVILPWVPKAIITGRQQVQFRAIGGDGVFTWTSQNVKLVAVSQTGLAETRLDQLAIGDVAASGGASRLGVESWENSAHVAHVQVALQRNPKITQRADIVFLAPERLSIVAYNFETALDDFVDLHVALYVRHDGKQFAFTACDTLHFDLEFSNDIFAAGGAVNTSHTPLVKDACHLVRLRATALGQTSLRVGFKHDGLPLSDTVSLVVYEPLSIHNPAANEIILPVGASRAAVYQHGPQPLFNIEAAYQKTTHYDEAIVSVTERDRSEYDAPHMHVFTVLCRRLGSTVLTLRLHNRLATDNFRENIAEFQTHVHCVRPRFINLHTDEKLRDGCPLRESNRAMHVQRPNDRVQVAFDVLDAQQRRLQNTSSLELEWHVAGTGSGAASKRGESVPHRRHAEESDIIAGVPQPVRDYIVMALPEGSPSYRIRGAVIGYDAATLRRLSIVPEQPAFATQKPDTTEVYQPTIENELNFLAVNATLFPYADLSIFLGQASAVTAKTVPLRLGSGHYQVRVSETGVIRAELNEEASAVIVTPLKLGSVVVELLDRCVSSEPSVLLVTVVDIGRIEVRMPDRVQVTGLIDAVVQLLDTSEQPIQLDTANLQAYDLHVQVLAPQVADVKLAAQQTDGGVGEIRYKVSGLELGETKIVFNAGHGARLMKSAPAPIQVFPPLKLHPRNSSIIVGTKVQIHSQGGPHPDANIVYAVANDNVAAIVDSSVAHGLRLGTTAITAKCVGISPITGRQIVYSQDTVHVHVVPLERFRIRTPLTRIRSGSVMPATLWGEPGDISPMILGTLSDLSVEWSTDQPDVLRVFGVFAEAGVQYGAGDSIAVRVKAIGTGKAKLRATVTSAAAGKQTIVVEVTVFGALELVAPQAIRSDAIVVPPNFSIDLKANLANAQFAVRDASAQSVVAVTRDGMLTSGDTVGRDLVIASSLEQTLDIPVEVKNIQYLLATLHTPTPKLRHAESHIPRGSHLLLKVTLHDNLGREFAHSRLQDGGGSTLRHKLSHREMADVHVDGNWTIGIHLPREVSGMLAVSLRDTAGVKFAEDYVKLSVAPSAHTFPAKTIFSVGDIICFDSPLAYSTNWISSDGGLVHVDSATGIARVLAARSPTGDKVAIINGDRQLGHVQYALEVHDAAHIAFQPHADIFNGQTYRAPLIVSHAAASAATQSSNVYARNVSTCSLQLDEPLAAAAAASLFRCTVRSAQAGNSDPQHALIGRIVVQPVFDRTVGSYACELRLPQADLSLVTAESLLELEATLGNGLAAARKSLRLVPAVTVVPRVLLAEQLAEQVITVRGVERVLQTVEVKSSAPTILEVKPITKTTGAWQYRARLLQPIPVESADAPQLAVLVTSAHSQQLIRVPVQSVEVLVAGTTGGGTCGRQPLYNVAGPLVDAVSNMGLVISVLIAVAVVIWAFVYCWPSRAGAAPPRFDEGLSPFKSHNRSNTTNGSGTSSPLQNTQYPASPGRFYPGGGSPAASPTGAHHRSVDEGSPIYGHSTPMSPGQRVNRRFL